MEVNIWSDVRCPFCYIGKRKFEKALDQFPQKDKIKIIWRSFELDPNLKTNPEINALDHFAKNKGMSREQAEQMTAHSAQAAKEAGLEFDINQMVVANSFNAHRLIQFAKTKDLGSEVEEELFKAHFMEGKNIDDKETLLQTGTSIGLEKKELEEVLSSDKYTKEVNADIEEAASLGIRGVPFFVFNNKYAVSGAQAPEVFEQALEQSWNEFEKEKKPLIINEGDTCSTDGNCI